MGLFWFLTSSVIYFICILVIGILSFFTFTSLNILTIVGCILIGVLVLGLSFVCVVVTGKFLKWILFAISLIGIFFVIGVSIYCGVSIYHTSLAFRDMIDSTLSSTKSFIDDLENITQNVDASTGQLDLGTLNFNTYVARLELANAYILDPNASKAGVDTQVDRILQDQKAPEPNYASMLAECAAQELSPPAPEPLFVGYDNFFAYRMYEAFATHGILCSFTHLNVMNFKKWPYNCSNTCGYKHLTINEPLANNKKTGKALEKYMDALVDQPLEVRSSCICYSYYTIVSLGTDLSYLLYFVFLCLFPLFVLGGCCCMWGFPVASARLAMKKPRTDD